MNSKLTDAQIEEIKRLYANGIYQRHIAAKLGLHQGQVSRIVNGKSNNREPFMKGVFQRILDGTRLKK